MLLARGRVRHLQANSQCLQVAVPLVVSGRGEGDGVFACPTCAIALTGAQVTAQDCESLQDGGILSSRASKQPELYALDKPRDGAARMCDLTQAQMGCDATAQHPTNGSEREAALFGMKVHCW